MKSLPAGLVRSFREEFDGQRDEKRACGIERLGGEGFPRNREARTPSLARASQFLVVCSTPMLKKIANAHGALVSAVLILG
jgi:hypothetical protein